MNKRVMMVAGLSAVSAAAICATTARATIVDLTQHNSSGFINGARYETSDFRSAGTGVIDSFVRIQANGTERGYNTSGRPTAFDENTSGNFTRNLGLSEISTQIIGGVTYYEFLLDINQQNNGTNSLLSLDRVEIFTSPTGSQTTTNVASLGTLRYDMDAAPDGDSRVELDYNLESGSGQGDMFLFVPVSDFAGAAQSDFVYLYSEFGTPNASNDGFEEWAVDTNNPVNPVPLPFAAGMGLAGLAGVTVIRRRA